MILTKCALQNICIVTFITCVTLSCGSTPEKRLTLRDIDLSTNPIKQTDTTIAARSEDEIKQAYYQYLREASSDDNSRQAAMARLAQMELDLTNKLIKDSQNDELLEDSLYSETLNRTITLLTTSLKEFPKAKGNDTLLYQLAHTYDQVGEFDNAYNALKELVSRYKNSKHYAEAQFRIAETAFINGDYITAEDAYTEVITTPEAERFYEKAFFKRGWTRYKQELYIESVDDYLESLTIHDFPEQSAISNDDKELFDEYFRAIGLSFSHLNGAESLRGYFTSGSNFKYLYHTYSVISDIYLKQERYSDSANTMMQFVEHHPDSDDISLAKLKIIQTWQTAGFAKRVHEAIEEFYVLFNPDVDYWKNFKHAEIYKTSVGQLREYIVKEAGYFHSLYQKKGKASDLSKASTWYQRYIRHYASHAQKDGFYRQYSELLYAAKDYDQALKNFEIAAFDGDIILDKGAAYSSISLANQLYKSADENLKPELLEKITQYTILYCSLYPNDEKSISIAINAAQLAFNNQNYSRAILLTETLPKSLSADKKYVANFTKARAYFESAIFSDAESTFLYMLDFDSLSKKQFEEVNDNLALSIYRQGEAAKSEGNTELAIRNLVRVSDYAPTSEIASTALYDAIALAMQSSNWTASIEFIERFKSLYPGHKFENDVTKKLSIAYLNSNQGDKAAREFERISSFEQDEDVKMAALWQAAELYESKGKTSEAIRSFRNYANNYKKPFPQYMEAMAKLCELYKTTGNLQNRYFWQKKIAAAGRRAQENETSERTIYLAAATTLELAIDKHKQFSTRRLVAPLKDNLRKKKTDMQDAIKMYGNASAYGLAEITTQSTFSIGSIYQEFSVALLESERPQGLSDDELEQYEILLEDQAFPFEDKAIEFYETNMARSRDAIFNTWLQQSRSKLSELFPTRYTREFKIEGYISNE